MPQPLVPADVRIAAPNPEHGNRLAFMLLAPTEPSFSQFDYAIFSTFTLAMLGSFEAPT